MVDLIEREFSGAPYQFRIERIRVKEYLPEFPPNIAIFEYFKARLLTIFLNAPPDPVPGPGSAV